MAVRAGASAVGLVSEMPSGPGCIPERVIAEIAKTIPPPVATFLLTSLQDPDSIVRQQKRCGAATLQLVDEQEVDTYAFLRRELPGTKLVQVVHVTGHAAIATACRVEAHVDAVLLDSGDPTAPVKELGGTGRTHDWSVSAEIRERLRIPAILAGGLDGDNVGEAIGKVRPFAVDACSRLRTDGALDPAKLGAFLRAVRATW